MIIVGHRGAKGLAPENTLAGIEKGIKAGADAIEFDVRITKDKKLVLCHDPDLKRSADNPTYIQGLSLVEIEKIKTLSGEPIPTIKEALDKAGYTPLIIEGKDNGWAEPLNKTLKSYTGPSPKVISKNHKELFAFSKFRPDLELFAVSQRKPFQPILAAKKFKFTGIVINFWLINPLVYFLARRAKLKIIVYTVNNQPLAKLLKLIYPHVFAITTDYPDRFRRNT